MADIKLCLNSYAAYGACIELLGHAGDHHDAFGYAWPNERNNCEWCGMSEPLSEKDRVRRFGAGTTSDAYFHEACKRNRDKWDALRTYLRQAGWGRAEFMDFVGTIADELPEAPKPCVHPGVSVRLPVHRPYHCYSCGRDVPREEL